VRCSSCEPLLDAYLEVTLPRVQAVAVSAHVRDCDDCAALLSELRVVDALLTTARAPRIGADFTASVVAETRRSVPVSPRRTRVATGLVLYLIAAWTALAFAAFHGATLGTVAAAALARAQADLATLGAAARAVAPATPLAAAAVTAVLLVDAMLIAALLIGYRRLRPGMAPYSTRGPRS